MQPEQQHYPQQPVYQQHPAQYQQPVYMQPVYLPAPPRPTLPGSAVATLVLGIVAMALFMTILLSPFGAFVGLVGLVVGCVAIDSARRPGNRGVAHTVWGLVLSGIPFGIFGLGWLVGNFS
jgi:hypothetical protein